jgi:hypothetical protein
MLGALQRVLAGRRAPSVPSVRRRPARGVTEIRADPFGASQAPWRGRQGRLGGTRPGAVRPAPARSPSGAALARLSGPRCPRPTDAVSLTTVSWWLPWSRSRWRAIGKFSDYHPTVARPRSVITNRTTLNDRLAAFMVSGLATASPARKKPANSPTVKPCARNFLCRRRAANRDHTGRSALGYWS